MQCSETKYTPMWWPHHGLVKLFDFHYRRNLQRLFNIIGTNSDMNSSIQRVLAAAAKLKFCVDFLHSVQAWNLSIARSRKYLPHLGILKDLNRLGIRGRDMICFLLCIAMQSIYKWILLCSDRARAHWLFAIDRTKYVHMYIMSHLIRVCHVCLHLSL